MGKARPGREKDATTPEGTKLPPGEKAETRGPGRAFVRNYLLRSLEVFMYWMPVWVPLILLAQIGTRGLQPALDEEQRLLEHERTLMERLEADEARARDLSSWHEAIDDEIYRERLRRLSQDEMLRRIEERGLDTQEPAAPPDSGEPEDSSE